MMKRFLVVVTLALVSMAGAAQNFRANLDESVKPGDDFWQYAVGGWLNTHPLDKEHPMNGAFVDLDEQNNQRINDLIMKYAGKKDLPQGSDGQKIGALYRLYMDSVGRNKMGYEPILPYLKQVRAIKTREAAERMMQAEWTIEQRIGVKKLHAMHINVGYPDKWQDMEKYIDIRENDNLVENFIRITQEMRQARIRKRWHQPVDKTIMPCSPQEVNAFYHPLYNSINFPAAILQPPFFDPEADYVCNYGAVGTVIGHEMSHGFDDEGCLYDKDGNLVNWWTDDDKAMGENIGDNGGLQIAYRAYENRMKQEPQNTIDGFTPAQRFYLAYAHIWASNATPEYIALGVDSDVHSPNIFRVNAALPMIDSWYDAFGVKPTDKMFIPKDKRASVW